MLGLQGAKVNTALVFYNPNPVRFKIKKMGFEVFVDNKKVTSVNDKPNIVVKPRKEFTIPLNATMKPEVSLVDALKGIANMFKSKELDLKVVGKLEIKGLFLKKAVGFDINKKLKFD